MKEFIAERTLVARSIHGLEKKLVFVRVGIPYWSDAETEAACPRQWAGLFEDIADARGVDLIHSLQMALDVESVIDLLKGKYEFDVVSENPLVENSVDMMTSATQRWIAERKVIAETLETGDRKYVSIRIGAPSWLPDSGCASCPVKLDGMFDHVFYAKGIDLMQALQRASNIDPILESLRTKYKFYWASGEGYFHEE